MPKITFLPDNIEVEAKPESKILANAIRNKIHIRFSCGSCRCGTCAVRIKSGQDDLTAMDENEISMLKKLQLPQSGEIRLACKTKVKNSDVVVDLEFQDEYSPDDTLEE